MTIQLTPAQHAILSHAHHHTDGKIVWFPDNLKGGARKKVLDALFNRALITGHGDGWFIAAEGYDAIGVARRGPITLAALDQVIASAEQQQSAPPRKTRANSKQALVIGMLRRPEGATIAQIMAATQWLAHSVRGAISGMVKKRLGYEVVTEKGADGQRAYRII